MTCSAAVPRRYETREVVYEYLASRCFQRNPKSGGTAFLVTYCAAGNEVYTHSAAAGRQQPPHSSGSIVNSNE
jgi:hypothetical protein